MFEILLPDKSKLSFDSPTTPIEVARSISPSLAKAAVCARLNNIELIDMGVSISKDCSIEIITERDSEGLDVIRHSFAHLIGHAVKQIYPNSKMAIGPVITDGFYYDVEFEEHLSEYDLRKIEEKINHLVKQNPKPH